MKSNLFNIRIDLIDTCEAFKLCNEFFNSQTSNTIYFLNAHCFNVASVNQEYRSSINQATLLLNDGIGIKIASYLAGLKVKENMNGTDLIPKIIAHANDENKRIYLLGSEKQYVKKAASNINSLYNNDLVVSYHSGYFDVEEELIILQEIAQKNIDMLIVGMGVPKQELWIQNHIKDLDNVRIVIAGGAIIDFMANRFHRAPHFLRAIGMEWLFRFLYEPVRLSKRYLIGNLVFLYRISVLAIRGKMKKI